MRPARPSPPGLARLHPPDAQTRTPGPVAHRPPWPDPDELDTARGRLAQLPPLVFAGEIDTLRAQLADATAGDAFVCWAGDCAEPFAGDTANRVRDLLRVVLSMALVLTWGGRRPVVKIARAAGQYAKPRSSPLETRDGIELASFFGDAVNAIDFTPGARRPDPARLVEAYHRSAATLNLLRGFCSGGFADLHHVGDWILDFAAASDPAATYRQVAADLAHALDFFAAVGGDPATAAFSQTTVFSSHEALLLDYEEPLVRIDSLSGRPFATSAHMLWIGERTRDPRGAHVTFAAHVANPVGVKLGPSATTADAAALAEVLNPDAVPGRLTFVSRRGAGNVDGLADVMAAVAGAGIPVVWVCDPMHGNTRTAGTGHKTRGFDDIVTETHEFFDACAAAGVPAGGIHLELTGEDVTECVGGPMGLAEGDLGERYETLCDPRLNAAQGLAYAFEVAGRLTRR